jgi:hypothetical protein
MASRELKVEIVGDASSLQKALGKASSSSSKLGGALKTLGKAAAIGVGAAFAGLAVTVKQGFDELEEGQQVAAQTAAALKSTGKAANVTAKDVETLAKAQSELTGIDDEAVQAAENMLLTFTAVRNEVGKNNDIFNQATVAVGDMATRMNNGAIPSAEQLSQTAIRVGKALNDPIKGMGALSRVGVQFTESQKKAITAMVKSGDTMGAQKLILAELTKEFGGSAKAAGETFPGQLAKLRNSFDDAAAGLSVLLLPALTGLVKFLSGTVIPAIQTATDWIGNFFDKFGEAKGIKGKLGVVADEFTNLGRNIVGGIRKVLFGYDQIGHLGYTQHVQGVGEKIAAEFQNIDWSAVGKRMVDGLVTGLEESGRIAKAMADRIMAGIRQINWEEVGAIMGPGLAAAIAVAFATLLDVGFWVRNWEAALAIALVAFGGVFGKLAGKLLAPLTRMGSDIVVTIAGAIEKFSPTLAAAFLRMMSALPGLLTAPFRALETAVRTFFGRLGGLAVFTMRVLGLTAVITALSGWAQDVARIIARVAADAYTWAKRIGANIVNGILDFLNSLRPRVMGKLAEIGSAIAAIAVSARAWAASIGAAIIDGIISGLSGLIGRLGSAIAGAVGGAISWAKGHVGSTAEEHASKEIGWPIAQGVLRGWIEGTRDLPQKLAETTRNAIDAAARAVEAAKGALTAAFQELTSEALAAFDKLSSQIETRTEKLIRQQDERRAKAERQAALAEARAGLAAAQAAQAALTPGEGEDPAAFAARVAAANQAVIDALKAVEEAKFQIQRAADLRRAEQERKALENRRELQRRHFEEELEKLQNRLLRGELTQQQANERLIALFKKYEIPFKKAAISLGSALAEGLREAADEVGRQAAAVRNEIMRHLSNIVVRINVDVVVPDKPDRDNTPGRQHGGPVRAGSPYVVGEAGPELFIPRQSGYIAPSVGGSGGGLGGGISLNFYGTTVGSSREFEDTVRRAIYDVNRRNPRLAI